VQPVCSRPASATARGKSTTAGSNWAARAQELAAGTPALEIAVAALLRVREVPLQELRSLDRKLIELARTDWAAA